MDTKSVPLPTPEDPATERLITAVESAIDGIQERLANLAADGQDAKWSVSDLVRPLQLRNQLQGERPTTIRAYWVDGPHNNQPEPNTRAETYIDAPGLPRNHRNNGARK